MNPCTGSDGQVAHQAMNADDFPASVNMFQSAFTLRHRLETGTTSPVFGSFARKSMMPCCSGGFPVATLVQRSGESTVLFTTDPALTRPLLQKAARELGAQELAVARRVVHVRELPRLGSGKTDYVELRSRVMAEESASTGDATGAPGR